MQQPVKTAAILGILYFLLQVKKLYDDEIKNNKKKKEKQLLYGNKYFPWSKPANVVLSLTTSPKRIQFLKAVFDAIDPRTYDIICLNLPDIYKPTGEKYVIPAWMHSYPKLVINRFGTDIGPISKLLPAVEKYPNAFIVTIDDDSLYRRFFIQTLGYMYDQTKSFYNLGEAVYATNGLLMEEYWQNASIKHQRLFGKYCIQMIRSWKEYPHPTGHLWKTPVLDFRTIDLIEGFAGIMYPPGSIKNINHIKELSATSKQTFLSDDMTISMYLTHAGVQKISTKKQNKNFHHILALPYGFQADALHQQQDHFSSYYIAFKHMCSSSSSISFPFFRKVYENKLMAANDLALELKARAKIKNVKVAGLAFPFLESVNVYDDFTTDPWMVEKIKQANIITCTQYQVRHLVPLLSDIKQNFVLVTTNCDYSAPNDVLVTNELKNAILVNPFLQMWFTNNADEVHPKITPIPLGIDWHTPQFQNKRNDIQHLENLFNSSIQESKRKTNKNIESKRKTNKNKIAITFINSMLDNAERIIPFSLSKRQRRETRRYCLQKLNQNVSQRVEIVPFTRDRIQFWNLLKEYSFVASPHGVGEDCHRTYEALALGCIVIVQCHPESGLRPMFQEMRDNGIKIVIVDSWSHVTNELLDQEHLFWSIKTEGGKGKINMLESNYWIDKILSIF